MCFVVNELRREQIRQLDINVFVNEVTRVEMKVPVQMTLLGPNVFIAFHML